jgi:O-antigen ligase
MQSVATFHIPYPVAHRQSGSALIAYLRAGTLSIWLLTLMFRYWWIGDWFALQALAEQNVDIKSYYYVGFAIALAAHLTVGVAAWFAVPFVACATWSGRLLTAFCVLMLILSPLSLAPRASMIYSVATWCVFAMLCVYWESDYRIVRKMTVFAGIVVIGWVFVLLLKHGLVGGFGSGIGGANRNTTTFATVGGFVLCMLSTSRTLRAAAILSAIFLAVVVTSRGGIVAIGVFLAVYYAAMKGSGKALVHGVLGVAALGIMLLVLPTVREFILEDVMRLHDQGRGLGSGFTGRVDYWKKAAAEIWQAPVIGHGFRASANATTDFGAVHSGYLRLLLEAGFVGAGLVVGAVLVEGFRRFYLALQFRSLTLGTAPGIDLVESIRINAVVCATLAMTLVIWIYEQLYINLGSVVCVAFFLMMAAPAYITTQGVAVRR